MREQAAALGQTPAEFRRDAEARVPMGCFLEPREVAEFVRRLCSPAADAITGQALSMDGGQTPF